MVLTALVVVVVLVLPALAWWRSGVRARRTGAFSCALGRSADGPWRAGTATYGASRLTWTPGPLTRARGRVELARRRLAVTDRVPVHAHGVQLLVVTCRAADRTVHLRMSPEAYAGLTSWLEATPTGVDAYV
ncbi:hypothetical protein Cma02nite_28370 [Cellulomonas marina]|uniref:DUF2550 domain-containing protein n=1 Tax=Cellulomonas marina TaxID=988821 RepID=A0A1I1AT06_9CELL|nr:hypothetical protein Cma02nite_28370 [Cellulomonas marina]SFB41219.1 Protein of unknown function [Cellulomonas marina]